MDSRPDEIAGLVKRLRNHIGSVAIMDEAAAALERMARIRALEAEIERLKDDVTKAYGQAAEFAQKANAMKNERDAIEAKTIERCAEELEIHGWLNSAAAIRALRLTKT